MQNNRNGVQNPSAIVLGIGLTILICVGGFFLYKLLTKPAPTLEVERGSVAVLFEGALPVVLDPGTHEIDPARVRHTIVRPGEEVTIGYVLDFVPGRINQIKDYGRDSFVVQILPIAGDAVRDAKITHVKVPITVTCNLPEREHIERFFDYAGRLEYRYAGIMRCAHNALVSEENNLGEKKWFGFGGDKVTNEDIAELVKQHLEQTLRVTNVAIEVGEVRRLELNQQEEAFELRQDIRS